MSPNSSVCFCSAQARSTALTWRIARHRRPRGPRRWEHLDRCAQVADCRRAAAPWPAEMGAPGAPGGRGALRAPGGPREGGGPLARGDGRTPCTWRTWTTARTWRTARCRRPRGPRRWAHLVHLGCIDGCGPRWLWTLYHSLSGLAGALARRIII